MGAIKTFHNISYWILFGEHISVLLRYVHSDFKPKQAGNSYGGCGIADVWKVQQLSLDITVEN